MKNNNLKIEDISRQMSTLSEAIAFYEENFDEYDDDYTDRGLTRNATQVDKAKYQLCKDIFKIKIRHKLSNEEVAKRLKISENKIRQIKYSHYDKFNLEELTNYSETLANSVE